MRLLHFLFTVCILSCLSVPLTAQSDNINAIDRYFTKYVDDERFSVVYISGRLFNMLGSLDKETVHLDTQEDADALMRIAKNLEGLRILTADQDAQGLYAEAKSKIELSVYEPLMTIRNKDGSNIELLVRETKGKIKELLMLGGGEEFFLLSFIGDLDLTDISHLANDMNK